MKKLLTKAVLSAFLALAVISCKEDATSTPDTPAAETKSYYAMKENSYWVYDNYDFKEDGTTIDEETRTYDSIAVTGKKVIDDKEAFTIFRHSNELDVTDLVYSHAFTADEFFISDDFIKSSEMLDNEFFSGIQIPNYGWLKIADSKATTTWDLLTPALAVDNIGLPDGLVPGVTNIKISPRIQMKMTRKETGTAIDPVTKKSVNTITFEMKYDISGEIKAKAVVVDITGSLKGSRVTYMVYAEGIGLIKTYSPKQLFELKAVLPGLGEIPVMSNQENGDESVLRTYRN